MAEIDDIIAKNASVAPKSKVKRVPKSIPLADVSANSVEVQMKAAEMVEQTLAIAPRKPQHVVPGQPKKIVEQAFKQFEEAAGKRAALIRTLQHCPETSLGFKLVQKLLQDPSFLDTEDKSLFATCQKHKLSLALMVLAFKDAKAAETSLSAIVKLAEQAPVVIDQLGTDATNRFEACPVCEGKTRVRKLSDTGEWQRDAAGGFITQLCYNCRGKGKIFKEHDTNSRKQFLQITGILDERKGGININTGVQTQVGLMKLDFTPGDGSFEKLIRAVDQLNLPTREDVLDAEVIETEIVVYEEANNPESGQT